MHEKGIHKGMCAVAVFEAAKGALALMVLLAGLGAFHFMHWGTKDLAGRLIGGLHLRPGGLSAWFLKMSEEINDSHLAWAGAFIAVYAAFRFAEAYGLWRERTWAEWLALISGAVYLPVEIYEIIQKVTWVRVAILVVNLAIVCFMALVLIKSRKEKMAARASFC